MALRFTETGKWADPWFRKLPPMYKLIFLYLIDNCNNAGFLEVDEEYIAFQTGLGIDEVLGAIEGLNKGCLCVDRWVWVKRFLRYQKNESLNSENNAHKQIISQIRDQIERFRDDPEIQALLDRVNLSGTIEKTAPDKGLIRGTGNNRTGKGLVKDRTRKEVKFSPEELESVYQEYPRKIGKPEALKAITKALQKIEIEDLRAKVRNYAQSRAGQDQQFTPYPATWFNQERWNDEIEAVSTNSVRGGRSAQQPMGMTYELAKPLSMEA